MPDFYQGSELWDFSLVDPDNRRPVDFSRRQLLLQEIRKRLAQDPRALASELLSAQDDGSVKLFLVYQALRLRNRLSALFQRGSYIPLVVEGACADHLIAYARQLEQEWSVTIAPRFLVSLVNSGVLPLGDDVWKDTVVRIPSGAPAAFDDALFGGRQICVDGMLKVGSLFAVFPVALLAGHQSEAR